MEISGAYVDLHQVVPAGISMNTVSTELESDAGFAEIAELAKADPKKVQSVNAVFVYKITKGGKVVKTWSKLII